MPEEYRTQATAQHPTIRLASTKAIPTPLVIVLRGMSIETPGAQASITHFCVRIPWRHQWDT